MSDGILQIFVVEGAHTFGLCLFVFKVLPRFDVVRALLLMNATCVVPALFKLLLTKGQRGSASVVADILALAMQCSVFFIYTIYLTRDGEAIDDVALLIQIAASLVLVSIRYWENFIDRDVGVVCIQSLKARLRAGRCKTYIFASLWKIALTFTFLYVLVPDMTPMADIFRLAGNETAYAVNRTRTVQEGDRMDFTTTFSSSITVVNNKTQANFTDEVVYSRLPSVPTPGKCVVSFVYR